MSQVTTVLITGANAGLGKDCARQLAEKSGIKKIYLGCRNPQKAADAKKDLEESTGKSIFDVLIIDVTDLDSVRKAVKELKEPIDGLVLNAGGLGGGDPATMTDYGIPIVMAVNVLGHVLLVDLLLEQKKLTGSVVYSGSEAARGVPTFGMKKPELKDGSVEEFTSMFDGSAYEKKTTEALYGPAKLMGALWMSSMARKVPTVRFVTISPGGTTGTDAASEQPWFKAMMFSVMMKAMELFGQTHSLSVGAKRYVDALVNEGDAYKSGTFYASKKGVTGEIVDQVEHLSFIHDEKYQENASAAVHSFIK